MIFDWIENSKRIVDTGSVTLGDEWDRKRVWKQETCLLRYLIFALAKGRDDCRSVWESLKGGTFLDGSLDEYSTEKAFSDQIAAALRLGPLEEAPKVWITDSELSYINSLQAPYEVKKYWARLLVYIKSERSANRLPRKTHTIEAHMRRDAGFFMEGGQSARRERGWSLKCGVPFPVGAFINGKTAFGYYRSAAWMYKGRPAAQVSMGDFRALDALIDRKSFTCPSCGSRFARSDKAMTDLCPVCWAKKNREDKRLYMARNKKPR